MRCDLFKDKRICRSHGYSVKGKRGTFKRMYTSWGPRITAIPVISMEGLLDVGVYNGHVTGETFLHFVNHVLAPCLLPFNGFNPRSIVVLGIWSRMSFIIQNTVTRVLCS